MPLYEYTCNQCTEEFEELVFGDTPPPCPACGSGAVERLLSCCSFKSAGGGGDWAGHASDSAGSAKSGCAGCSGGSCASCG